MKKRIIAFLCMMMVFTVTTAVALAGQEYWDEQCDDNPYRVSKWGDASVFVAYGTNNLAYVTLENNSGSTKYLTCQMREYSDNVGWTDSRADGCLSAPDSCFREPSLEASAFPGQLLLVAAYYMQIRETFEATCTVGALLCSS